jgi:acyl-CoA thioester hydrolase
MKPFKHTTPIQIRFKDIDMMGHVNNANYITYFELARLTYFDALKDEGVTIDWVNEGVILAKIEMEYKQPILLEDKAFVTTWVSRIGSKSFDMTCSIVRIVDGVEIEAARGLAVIVCFNYKANETIAIPELWKRKMMIE